MKIRVIGLLVLGMVCVMHSVCGGASPSREELEEHLYLVSVGTAERYGPMIKEGILSDKRDEYFESVRFKSIKEQRGLFYFTPGRMVDGINWYNNKIDVAILVPYKSVKEKMVNACVQEFVTFDEIELGEGSIVIVNDLVKDTEGLEAKGVEVIRMPGGAGIHRERVNYVIKTHGGWTMRAEMMDYLTVSNFYSKGMKEDPKTYFSGIESDGVGNKYKLPGEDGEHRWVEYKLEWSEHSLKDERLEMSSKYARMKRFIDWSQASEGEMGNFPESMKASLLTTYSEGCPELYSRLGGSGLDAGAAEDCELVYRSLLRKYKGDSVEAFFVRLMGELMKEEQSVLEDEALIKNKLLKLMKEVKYTNDKEALSKKVRGVIESFNIAYRGEHDFGRLWKAMEKTIDAYYDLPGAVCEQLEKEDGVDWNANSRHLCETDTRSLFTYGILNGDKSKELDPYKMEGGRMGLEIKHKEAYKEVIQDVYINMKTEDYLGKIEREGERGIRVGVDMKVINPKTEQERSGYGYVGSKIAGSELVIKDFEGKVLGIVGMDRMGMTIVEDVKIDGEVVEIIVDVREDAERKIMVDVKVQEVSMVECE